MKRLNVLAKKAAAGLVTLALISACGDEAGNGEVEREAVAVATTTVATKDLETRLHSIGRLVSESAPVLASEVTARVTAVYVTEGEGVVAGQLLIEQDSTEFELARREAQAAIEGLKVSIANEQRRVARYRDLNVTSALSQERLDDAEAKLAADRAALAAAEARRDIAGDRLAKASLEASFDAVVQRRHVSEGDYARVGDPLISVVDMQSLRAELPFPETVGAGLTTGQSVMLESPLAPGTRVAATIDFIRPQVGGLNRALVAIANVRNPGSWRPDATVEANVTIDRRPKALVVPSVAVVERPAGRVVYVLEGADRVREQVVQTGERLNETTEIISGLQAGQVIVSDGAYYLSDGALVEVRKGP